MLHPYCRESLSHRPLKVKRSSFLIICILLSMGNNPGAQIGNWPYSDLFFFHDEKEGERGFERDFGQFKWTFLFCFVLAI